MTLTASKTQATADGVDTVGLTALVEAGGAPLGGQTVSFALPSGPIPSAASAVTDASGRATIYLTCPALNSAPDSQTFTLTATSGTTTSNTVTVTFIDPPPGASFWLVRTSAGTYTVRASNLVDVGGIDLTIRYDATVLSNPHATFSPIASGAMTSINPNIPGILRAALMTTTAINGSGDIMSVSFTRQGLAGGGNPSLAVTLVNTNAILIPATLPADPGGLPQTTAPGVSTTTTPTPSSSGTSPAQPGTIISITTTTSPQ